MTDQSINRRSMYVSINKHASAFALPSRGEGWGLPLTEAMALEVPVIATNVSQSVTYFNTNES